MEIPGQFSVEINNYTKPDVQTVRAVTMILELVGKSMPANQQQQEKEAFFSIFNWAQEARQDVRALDRLLYLIGSGNFHYHEDKPTQGGEDRFRQLVEELAAIQDSEGRAQAA